MKSLTWIGTQGPTGDDIRRTKSGLLYLGEVIVWVSIQHDPAERPVREVLRRQRLSRVEDVDRILLGHLWADDLAVDVPGGEVASLDVLVHRPRHVVGVGARALAGLGRSEVLVALVGLDVDLKVLERSVLEQR